MNITLRPARPADAEEMARWFTDLANLVEWGGPEVSFPLTADQMAAWIAEGANLMPRICFTAVDANDKPIGHVEFLRDPPRKWARLGRFGIASARRDQGFGRALFDHAVRYAFTELGVEHLALAVATRNERARRLYLRAGFRDEGVPSESQPVGGQPYVSQTMSLMRTAWLEQSDAPAGAAKVA
jgi:RimJ/RimL family protein N-acetyltransferase